MTYYVMCSSMPLSIRPSPVLSKGANGIFGIINVSNDISVSCAHESETGTDSTSSLVEAANFISLKTYAALCCGKERGGGEKKEAYICTRVDTKELKTKVFQPVASRSQTLVQPLVSWFTCAAACLRAVKSSLGNSRVMNSGLKSTSCTSTRLCCNQRGGVVGSVV